MCFEIRSNEERFFKLGSEPLVEPLTIGDLAGPFFMALAFLGLSLVAFISEATFGCNAGVTSESRGYLRKTRGEGGVQRRKRNRTLKLIEEYSKSSNTVETGHKVTAHKVNLAVKSINQSPQYAPRE